MSKVATFIADSDHYTCDLIRRLYEADFDVFGYSKDLANIHMPPAVYLNKK